MQNNGIEHSVIISDDKLEGELTIPSGAQAIILFAHGSGSSRHSTRNQHIAQALNDAGFATLLVDLLTSEEKEIDDRSRHLRFEIDLLARRLLAVTQWLVQEPETNNLKIGYFGSSTGIAASLIATAKLGDTVKAIVSRGGRPDLADSRSVLEQVVAPTLLIVGGNDTAVIALNRAALKQLSHAKARELAIIPGAGHLFEERGKMEEVAEVAAAWFKSHLLNGRKFENKYNPKGSGLFSIFKEKPQIQIRFKDRAAAGEMLASLLSKYKDGNVIVIGIPRGGMLVADAVAKKLGADFDIVVPRKLRDPDNSENAIGAVMHDGSIYLDSNLVNSKVSDEYVEMEKSEQKKEADRRMALYRPKSREYDIKDRTVILVDDGIATGATIIAAARWLKERKPRLLVIGVPVAPKDVIEMLADEADHIEVISTPSASKFKTVERYYQDFAPVSDQQVLEIARQRFR